MSTEYDFAAPRLLAWDWQSDAACAGLDTAMFYQADRERGASMRRREARAKAVCANCRVIDVCLRTALRNHEPFGVWGGMSPHERARLISPVGA